ncbi:Pleiotropic drug resistance protein 1 [Spatholobus suberectus]|nr:Pleiotropic drug resistance protein 1 [Spatholobus suberectus]
MDILCTRVPVNTCLIFLLHWVLNVQRGKAWQTFCKKEVSVNFSSIQLFARNSIGQTKKSLIELFITPKEFAEAFQSSDVGRILGSQLATQFGKSKSHPGALATNVYGMGKWELFKTCASSEYLLKRRHSFYYIFRLCQRLPFFNKQRDLLFLPSWAYALPSWIFKIPVTIAAVTVWLFLTYFVIGYDPDAGREQSVAAALGSFALLIPIPLGGFILSKALEKHQTVKSEQSLSNEENGGSSSVETKENRKRGMILPFEPYSVTFDEVTYSVDMPQMFVEEVMELIELNPIRNAIVGLPSINYLSAEQRKRLTIAVECHGTRG